MAEGGYDLQMDNLDHEDEDYEDEDEDYEDEDHEDDDDDFSRRDDSSRFHHFNTTIEDEDKPINILDNIAEERQLLEESKDFLVSVCPDADLEKIFVIEKDGKFYVAFKKPLEKLLSAKNKIKLTYYEIGEDGKLKNIKGKSVKKLLKALGETAVEKLRKNTKKEEEIQIEMEELNLEVKERERLKELGEDEIKRLEEELRKIRDSESILNFEKERLENKLRNAEEELKVYNDENTRLKEELRKNSTEQNEEQLNNLYTHIRYKLKHLDSLKNELKVNKELFDNLEDELVKVEKLLEEKKAISISDRQVELDFIFEEKTKQIEELTQQLEILREEREKITVKLTMKQQIKEIFKKHGLTIFSITASVGTIITAIVLNLTSAVSSGLKTVKDLVVSLGKKLAQILPGMVGAIASFIFKTAGEALGFLAKNSWLLILFVVTYAVEQYTGKKK